MKDSLSDLAIDPKAIMEVITDDLCSYVIDGLSNAQIHPKIIKLKWNFEC